ncbi:hypothetical protein SAMN05192559_101614 [Halobacillus karajensis]|uniref:hypothetical protein n=1 Tax=Halobacillus karajensis TaxID=195088 RepID=UPI0008A7DC75|nr:hypothetical protein [Halobacillus karajensis]SEH46800.1 hypothetical protein SAMN05192559_101614 [Halobacillus karajensis]
MKKLKKITIMLLSVLMLSFAFNAGMISAESTDKIVFEDAEALEALNESVYVHTQERAAYLNKEKALSLYDFTKEEMNMVETELHNLTDQQIQEMINYAQANNDGVQIMVAPLIVWGGIAALGIFAGTALYFSSKYMNYKEKQNLVNRCYDVGGTPSLDSGDNGGIHSAPKKAWWKISNTYSFECVK